jgi:hypothetical protein
MATRTQSDTHQTYYYETNNGQGEFKAQSNEEALKLMPPDTTCLYTESDTRNGLPFIIVNGRN